MATHDLRCKKCNKLYSNMSVSAVDITDGEAYLKMKCECGSNIFLITWESGQAPKGYVQPDETIGRIWDRAGFDPTSKEAKAASDRAIKETQKNTLKNRKK